VLEGVFLAMVILAAVAITGASGYLIHALYRR
jgi:hypothetical protein